MNTLTMEERLIGSCSVRNCRSVAPIYKRFTDRLFVDGQGCSLRDESGNQYLDMTSGIGVLALGHASAIVSEAMKEAASHPLHTSNLFLTEPPLKLADALTSKSFADRVFFANSGTEANEAAIKFARHATSGERQDVVYFSGSFHGRTFASLAATDRLNASEQFGPLPAKFRRAIFNSCDGLNAINRSTAAVVVEPIQGEGGIRPADSHWLMQLRERCNEVGALLIFDEVQCGVGRTGKLWAYENAGVEPDLLTVAKPLAGGLPIGAVLMTERVSHELQAGCHGSTFGGGPAITHVALAVLDHISDPAFLADVRRKGNLLLSQLHSLKSPLVADIRGVGLMIGVSVSTEPANILRHAVDQGLLLTSAGQDVIRFLPPLTIHDNEIHECVERFQNTLERVQESND